MSPRSLRTWRDSYKVFSTIIAVVATATYFTIALNDYRASRERVSYAELESLRTKKSFDELRAQIDERNAQTTQLVAELTRLAHTSPNNSSAVAQQLAVVQHSVDAQKDQIDDLRRTLDDLGKTIESSPEKAVTIPLLRKDLDDFKISSQRDMDSLRAEMLRSYELNKWLIGLMLAAVFGMVLKGVLESRTPTARSPNFE